MVIVFIFKIGEEPNGCIIHPQMGELSKYKRNWKQQAGQPVLIGFKKIGVQINSGNKAQHNTYVGDKGINNTLLFYDTQVIFSYSFKFNVLFLQM